MLKDYCTVWKKEKEARIKTAQEYEPKELLAIVRLDRLHRAVMKEFPKEVNAQLWVYDAGFTSMQAVVILPENAASGDTILARRFLTNRYHKATRSFDSYNGQFAWHARADRKDRKGKYSESMEIRNTDPGKCKVIKYTETVTRFKTDCKGDGNV